MANIKVKRSAVPGKVPLVSDLALGEFAVNTHDGKVYTKKNVGGVETIVTINPDGVALENLQSRYSYVVSGSAQTTFAASYVVPYVDVYQNGSRLAADDYVATNGTSVVLAVAAEPGDVVEIVGLISYSANSDFLNVPGGIATADFLKFDVAATNTPEVAKLNWNPDDGTLEFGLKGGQVVLQVGQEQVQRIYNNTGSTLVSGQVVYVTGSQGNRLTVALASASGESTSTRTFGVVTETILNEAEGFIATSGLVRGLDTSSFAEGSVLWLGTTAGTYTTTRPAAPNHGILVGFVVRQHASVGSVFVHVANGYELDELHDVLIASKQDGQALVYEASSGLWKNKFVDYDTLLNKPTLVTQTDINNAIAALVDTAPATLDTLNELAAALGDDPNFATTITNSIATKLPLAGGTLTGNLEFSGTGLRIRGDLRTGISPSSRLLIQTSTGLSSDLGVIPNATSGSDAGYSVYSSSDPDNASTLTFAVTSGGLATIRSAITGTGTYRPITFQTGGSERVRIDTSGNVGIGTSSPVRKLHVALSSPSSSGQNASTGLLITNNDTSGTASAAIQFAFDPNNVRGYIDSGTYGNDFMAFGVAGSECMRIDASGNVGIGTSSPSYRLHVVGSGANAAQVRVQNTSSAQDSRAAVQLQSNASTFGAGLSLTNASDSAYPTSSLLLYNYDNQPIVFGTNNTERARIDSSGRLLVGVSSGTAKLQVNNGTNFVPSNSNVVNAAIQTQGAYGGGIVLNDGGLGSIWMQNGGTEMGFGVGTTAGVGGTLFINSSSNVGVGTNSPSTKLDVAGAITGSGQLLVNYNIATPANYYNGLQVEIRATSGTAGIGLHRSGFSHCGIYHDAYNTLKFDMNGGVSTLNATTGTILGSGNYNSYAPTLTGGGASGTWNITSNYAYNLTQGFNSNWNTDFQQAPAGSTILRGDTSSGSSTGGPGGTWWFQQNMRHTNASNYWGVQVAWGWEDNANILRTRNVTGGSYGSWVTYLNSSNYSSYALPIGGGTMTGLLIGRPSVGTNVNTNNDSGSFSIRSDSSNAASISFHRTGAYAINMGLGTDNVFVIGGWSASSNAFRMDGSGNLTMLANVTAYSDERVKTNWRNLRPDFIECLATVKHGIYDRTDQVATQVGVSAQSLQKILEHAVMEDAEGRLSVAYGNAALVAAVELAKRVVDQDARIAKLEALVAKLAGA